MKLLPQIAQSNLHVYLPMRRFDALKVEETALIIYILAYKAKNYMDKAGYFIHHLGRCKTDSDKIKLTILAMCEVIKLAVTISALINECIKLLNTFVQPKTQIRLPNNRLRLN